MTNSATKVVYLDYNATAPILLEVKGAMIDALDLVGNASAVHQLGRRCRAEIDKARKQLGAVLDVSSKDITFTSGGTEANHLVLAGLNIPKANIYASSVEHASIHKNVMSDNFIPVDTHGQVRVEVLAEYFERPNVPKLVSIALANSETGIVQHNLKDVLELCHKHNCLVHTDAVQAFGKIPVSFEKLGVDLMTISAHKVGGPKGVGALISKANIILKAPLLGGGQEKGLRSGTENIPAIVGFGVSAEIAAKTSWTSTRQLLDWTIDQLMIVNPKVRINSISDGLPNTLNISTPGYNKDTQVIHFDLNGVAVSAGSACSSGKVEQSHVLKAMGFEEVYVNSAIRLSLSPTQTKEDIDQFISIWAGMQMTKKAEGL
ncbi:MAG: cysteine desulfurase family protein [Alphaproteobacteria bacterium]|nr:cysteine desulfurase family protein [Alphaproteobacteria bacterium]